MYIYVYYSLAFHAPGVHCSICDNNRPAFSGGTPKVPINASRVMYLHMYIYVCIYIYIHTHTHVYIYIYIFEVEKLGCCHDESLHQ